MEAVETTSALLPPATLLSEVPWVQRNKVAPLTRLGLLTVGDLVRHYPRRREDRRRFDRFPDDEMDRAVCLYGRVAKTAMKRFGGWKRMFEVVVESGEMMSQPVTCRWFNMAFIQKMIVGGQRIVVYGRPKKKGRQIVIDHPEFEIIEEDEITIHMGRIVPVHPAGDGVSTRVLRSLIFRALEETDFSHWETLIPGGSPAQAGMLRAIHFPETEAAFEKARQHLVREEFFAIQLLINARRAEWNQLTGSPKKAEGVLLRQMLKGLPFELTAGQTAAIAQIQADLGSGRRMNRLLQGDVGSGKTLVALAAMLLTVESGWQAAIMAPTQILAEQHYLNFKRLLGPMGLHVALRTGSKKEAATLPFFGASKHPQILVGTHALLHNTAAFQQLGLVIIDEQHKFGVLQRARLIERGDAPDVLVMTATPIPRTMTQTLYGDLDVSTIREKPANRGAIQTAVRSVEKLGEVIEFLKKQLAKGRQAYIVYPLVDESEKLTAKAASAEFEKWQEYLAPYAVGLIHGRLSPEEKEAAMAAFREGKTAALVSTTVIEVGVDVPNATFMLVENAERFGLAQMHQLRGRIGRGEHRSYCILLHDPKAPAEAIEKLAVLEQTSDGFEVAEADLKLRGPGDLLGTAQTGLPPLKLGDLFRDHEAMADAQRLAGAIFEKDPLLEQAAHAALRIYVEKATAQMKAASG